MKLSIYSLFFIVCFCFSSCAALLEGMATTMMSGYGVYGGYTPMYSTGNMDYLLDPRYTMMQMQQHETQMNALNQQLINKTIRDVNAQEQAEYQQAKKYNPNLTLEQFRAMKAAALQPQNGTSTTGASTHSSSSTSPGTSSSLKCSRCNGSGRMPYDTYPSTFGQSDYKVTCSECGQQFLKSRGHNHVTCTECHGKGYL
ncbi:MAG: hypothetical protein IJ620_01030 [Bacteroidales bacterium]|nr:hypothetical protein [Bacteroidales bacterium]